MKIGAMKFFASTSLLLSFYLAATAVATDAQMPEASVQHTLEEVEGVQPLLKKNRNFSVWEFVQPASVMISDTIKSIYLAFDTAISAASSDKSCGTFSGKAGPSGEVSYRYTPVGRDCDTAAEHTTIAAAIEHNIKVHGSQPCRTECMDLTHGGSWNGYLLIGPTDGFDSSMYCGPQLEFVSYNSCGEHKVKEGAGEL
ncbi:hypothetical protein ACJZ2D_015577 [Fusarium nematophilum]